MSDNEATYELTEEEKLKLVAEATKIDAETQKIKTEIEVMKADKARTSAEAREFEAKAKIVELEYAAKNKLFEESNASDKYHRRYRFNDPVNDATVGHCMDRLAIWHRLYPGSDIEITFNSEGGSVMDGMELLGYLQELKQPWTDDNGIERKGHRIIIGARGMAASMAAILMQAGDERWMDREAYLLLHQISGSIQGKTDDAQDTLNWMKAVQERVLTLLATRAAQAGKNGTAKKPLSRDAFKKGMARKDWTLDSDACLEGGLVDYIKG